MDYETLSTSDKLQIARDTLRGKESDHFRASLVGAAEYGGQDVIDRLSEKITELQDEVDNLTEQVAIETPALPVPEAPVEPTPEPETRETDSKGFDRS